MPSARWEYHDALVFTAVGDHTSEGVGLDRILLIIDFAERIDVTREETENILRRLLGSGVVEELDFQFRLTAAGQELQDRCPAVMSRARVRWVLTHLRYQVACRPLQDWSLPAATFDAALEHNAET